MQTGRRTVAFLVTAVVALVAPLAAGAKDGVQATLTTNIPLNTEPGARLKVAWTLTSVDEDGQRRPFGASGVYVRLLSASGAGAEAGLAHTGAHVTGEYAATVAVPQGGIGDVEVGLVGWVSDASGTRRSDALFPITNDPVPDAGRAASPGFPVTNDLVPAAARVTSPDTRSTTWILIGLAGCLLTLGGLAVASVRRKGATHPTDRRSSVAQ